MISWIRWVRLRWRNSSKNNNRPYWNSNKSLMISKRDRYLAQIITRGPKLLRFSPSFNNLCKWQKNSQIIRICISRRWNPQKRDLQQQKRASWSPCQATRSQNRISSNIWLAEAIKQLLYLRRMLEGSRLSQIQPHSGISVRTHQWGLSQQSEKHINHLQRSPRRDSFLPRLLQVSSIQSRKTNQMLSWTKMIQKMELTLATISLSS